MSLIFCNLFFYYKKKAMTEISSLGVLFIFSVLVLNFVANFKCGIDSSCRITEASVVCKWASAPPSPQLGPQQNRDWSLANIDEMNCQILIGVQFSQLVPSNSGPSEAVPSRHESLVTPVVFPFVNVGKNFIS